VRLFLKSLCTVGIPAIVATTLLVACEDDPILAPQKGGKKAGGSYGNIAVAPPVDTLSTVDRNDSHLPINPEVY
jgi:hypothetical protein